MSKLNDIRNKFTEIQIGEDIFKLKFDMNAFAELEEIYGSVHEAMNVLSKGSVKGIKNVLWAGLAASHPELTPTKIGSMIDLSQIEMITKVLEEAISNSVPKVEEEAKDTKGKKESSEKK